MIILKRCKVILSTYNEHTYSVYEYLYPYSLLEYLPHLATTLNSNTRSPRNTQTQEVPVTHKHKHSAMHTVNYTIALSDILICIFEGKYMWMKKLYLYEFRRWGIFIFIISSCSSLTSQPFSGFGPSKVQGISKWPLI